MQGAFDADGRTPDIDDSRATWHVGDVEDRLKDLTLDRDETRQLVILFDLDIFEPSLAAWEYLRASLRQGDLLYFDEAFDADERRLLNEYILPAGKYECVGATSTGLGTPDQADKPGLEPSFHQLVPELWNRAVRTVDVVHCQGRVSLYRLDERFAVEHLSTRHLAFLKEES